MPITKEVIEFPIYQYYAFKKHSLIDQKGFPIIEPKFEWYRNIWKMFKLPG